MKDKILVIGGNGYIGKRLVDYLTNYDVYIMDPNYNSLSHTHFKNYYQNYNESVFKQFHTIILLGGQSSVSSSDDLLSVIDNNVKNFAKLLDCISKDQVFIYASSSSAYGNTLNKEVDETYTNYTPYNYYDWSKKAIDDLAEMSNKHFYGLRFGTVNGYSKNLRNDLMINSMINNAKTNNKIIVSNEYVNRPILGINDLCNAILRIIVNSDFSKRGIYNINSFNSNVKTIAEKVAMYTNVPVESVSHNNISIVNYKLQTKMYDFKINSKKFCKNFDFQFKETLDTIILDLLDNWHICDVISNRMSNIYNKTGNNIINTCNICGLPNYSLLDLGNQPLANNYADFQDDILEEFPLHLHFCKNCFHVQLNYITNPEKLFKEYLYVSGTSKTLQEYFKNFAINTVERHVENNFKINDTPLRVLDIASNDASQLDAFKTLLGNDVITVGVDPAENIYKQITKKKTQHNIICNFFNEKTVSMLQNIYMSFDIIIAQNVFAHVNYLSEFLKYCKLLLSETGTLYIQTSQKDMILNNQFDTVYHEHLNFFNSYSMKLLCETNGLILNNVYEHTIHGTSYIFIINKSVTKERNIEDVLEIEKENKLYNLDTYRVYNFMCKKYKHNLSNKIIDYHLDNKKIIAYGSTAKSMTTFNYCGVSNKDILYMIDDNLLKWNKYTPKSGIQIKPFAFLQNYLSSSSEHVVIIISAWNFYDEIKTKLLNTLENIKNKITLLNLDTLEEEVLYEQL